MIRHPSPATTGTATGTAPAPVTALTLPGMEVAGPIWQVRHHRDPAALALADRHDSRCRPGSGQLGPPGRKLVLVSCCERAVWVSHWPYPQLALDGLDAWRRRLFRNEGAGLSSQLIAAAAMALTARLWDERPADGWVTWVDVTRTRRKRDPGRCFRRAGWTLDRAWTHPRLLRLRAEVADAQVAEVEVPP